MKSKTGTLINKIGYDFVIIQQLVMDTNLCIKLAQANKARIRTIDFHINSFLYQASIEATSIVPISGVGFRSVSNSPFSVYLLT